MSGGKVPYLPGGDLCLPTGPGGMPGARYVDQGGGGGVPYGAPVAAARWGFMPGCTTAPRVCEEYAAAGALPVGSGASPARAGLTSGEVQALLQGSLPVPACAPGDQPQRTVCRIHPESRYYAMNAPDDPAQRRVRRRACCLLAGSVFDASDAAMAEGCAANACAGSDSCRAFAAGEWCRDHTADGTPADGLDSPPNAVLDDALCRSLGEWGEAGKEAHDAMMTDLCFDPGEEGLPARPSRWFRQPGCLRWCRENFERCRASGLGAWCSGTFRSSTPGLGPPPHNDVCACAYSRAIYDDYRRYMLATYNIPPSMLDDRPMCSFPGCASSLVPDAASVDPARGRSPCPALNLNICTQTISIDNKGTIGDVQIKASCRQSVSDNDGQACEPGRSDKARVCPTSQACDLTTERCRPPENAITPCESNTQCANGWVCDDETGFCRAGDGGGGDSQVVTAVVVTAAVVGGVGLLAAIGLGANALVRKLHGGGRQQERPPA